MQCAVEFGHSWPFRGMAGRRERPTIERTQQHGRLFCGAVRLSSGVVRIQNPMVDPDMQCAVDFGHSWPFRGMAGRRERPTIERTQQHGRFFCGAVRLSAGVFRTHGHTHV